MNSGTAGTKKTGNQNFNSHVSGRFYALEELMRRLNLTHVIHLEGDIMIYDNMLPVVQSLARCQYEMASTVIDSSGVIPSILYIRHSDSIGRFTTYLNAFFSCGLRFGESITSGYANDMTYLMNFYQLYGSRYLGLLPTWDHVNGELCVVEDLRRQISKRAKGSNSSVYNSNRIPSIDLLHYPVLPSTLRGTSVLFDTASFGQYYSTAATNVSSGVRGEAMMEGHVPK